MAEPFKILTLNQISKLGLDRFPAGRYVVGSKLGDPDAILVRSHDMHSMKIPAQVRAIGRAGAGVNNIPVDAMSKRGVPVFNAPGANANAPALKFVDALQGDDETIDRLVEDGKRAFAGIELPRQTLGVIGLGKIGSLVADAAIKLGMEVLGYDPEITVEAAWSLSSRVRKAHSIEEVLRGSEFVTVHVPLVDATRGLINADRIKVMKQGAILLNFSRDGVVDNDAVLAGLAAKHLRGYVCDFPAQKLIGQPLVVALPHLGASTREAEDNCAVMVADQVRDFLEDGNVVNAVNFPNVVMGRESPFRLGIANANVPKMVGQISAAVGNARLNIHNMLNKSKGEMAYTLVDVDSPVTAEVIAEIAGIEGVLAVRYLPVEQ
jgi:D-3-phosphoglycerate dehydrogenase